jgi:hypothetical protein
VKVHFAYLEVVLQIETASLVRANVDPLLDGKYDSWEPLVMRKCVLEMPLCGSDAVAFQVLLQ